MAVQDINRAGLFHYVDIDDKIDKFDQVLAPYLVPREDKP
jgi:hypothetical protein